MKRSAFGKRLQHRHQLRPANRAARHRPRLMAAREALSGYDHVIVLSGDAPLITAATIQKLCDFHRARNRP